MKFFSKTKLRCHCKNMIFTVIEPEKKHVTKEKFADLVVFCTPPFEIRNVEFCEFFKENT